MAGQDHVPWAGLQVTGARELLHVTGRVMTCPFCRESWDAHSERLCFSPQWEASPTVYPRKRRQVERVPQEMRWPADESLVRLFPPPGKDSTFFQEVPPGGISGHGEKAWAERRPGCASPASPGRAWEQIPLISQGSHGVCSRPRSELGFF